MKTRLIFFLVPLLFVGCTRFFDRSCKVEPGVGSAVGVPSSSLTPADVVKRFVEMSANAKLPQDKRSLQDFCAGDMRRAIERMSDEEFRLTYINASIKIENIRIIETSTQGETAKVHYEVKVENHQGTELTHETNEREVELSRSQGNWYIEFIRPKGTDKLAFTRGMLF